MKATLILAVVAASLALTACGRDKDETRKDSVIVVEPAAPVVVPAPAPAPAPVVVPTPAPSGDTTVVTPPATTDSMETPSTDADAKK